MSEGKLLSGLVYNTVKEIAERDIPNSKRKIEDLQKELNIRKDKLTEQIKIVEQACNEYGFVLETIDFEEGGPYRLKR